MKNDNLKDLKFLAESLDAKFTLPGGFKIGWDGILGLLPGIGDITTSCLSFYIILRAAALGCSQSVILQMGLNVLIENFIGVIPILGNVFDFFWKANLRNLELINAHQKNPQATERSSFWSVVICIGIILGSLLLTFFLAALILYKLLSWILVTLQ